MNGDVTKQDIYDLHAELGELKAQIEQLSVALVGSRIGKDGGLVERINKNETRINELEKKVVSVEKRNDKTDMYVKIIWTLSGSIATGLFMYLLKLIFKA
jgi:hypothetical protein